MIFPTRAVLFALALTSAALAQNPPAAPKQIPPPGITLTDAERAELTTGAGSLRNSIDALARELSGDERLTALLPDVEIFHKAVDWALRDNTFYTPKEIEFARHLLTEGRDRAAQLRQKQAPWLTATGLIVRGYRSKLDGSVQPYGLVVPTTPSAGESRLMVWLLGRGEKRTELAFLAEREAGPAQLAPQNTLVLVPYGRFCNATKFAGEVDVLEALAAVRAQYRIDANRILVAGFSMGGGSTWHLATHFSGLWCAASPGAGFAETPIFTRALAPGREQRPAWEQTLWRWYEATGTSGNLFNCPTVAYSGEIDPQKEAADLMEAAMAKEGLKLERFIGPQTPHRYHPETKEALTRRLDELLAKGRDPQPREVHLTTYTLRYPEASWVRILGLEKHWERADVKARIADDRTLHAETKNVTALELNPLHSDSNYAGKVIVDGDTLDVPSSSASARTLVRREGHWKFGNAPGRDGTLAKQPGLTGPVDDAFMEPFLFVRPSGRPINPEVGAWVESELTAATKLWRDVYRGDARVKDDRAVSPADIAGCNLIIWGDPSSNTLLARIVSQLPVQWDKKELVFRGKTYDAAQHAPILIFPNPLNPRHYVVLNSGLDFRADGYGNNALQTPKLPDWAVVDLRTPPGSRWPGKIVAAGFFDELWK